MGPKGSTKYTTGDVSRGGVFIKTDSPKSLRQLIRLQIGLNDGRPPIEAHGMVVRTISPGESEAAGEPPGMGIEFIAFGGEPRQRWEDHLRGLQAQSKPQSPVPSTATPSPTPKPQASTSPPIGAPTVPGQVAPNVRISHKPPAPKKKLVRYVFPIPLQEVDQLFEIYERDFGEGVMFLYTREKIPIGERVTARVIHPINLEEFDIHGKVKQIHSDPKYPGLTIALRPSTLARREKFKAFIEAGLPEEDLAVEIVEE